MYMKKSCIIGYNGFVGSNLIRQYDFDLFYNSKNYKEIENKEFNLVVCCGISAAKWWANLNGNEDLNNINNLLNSLKTIKCNRFVLISTIDVYDNINGDFTKPKPVDIRINWREANRTALIEIKFIGTVKKQVDGEIYSYLNLMKLNKIIVHKNQEVCTKNYRPD